MRRPTRFLALLTTLPLLSLAGTVSPSGATVTSGAPAPQPAPDITKMDYTPVGFYKPGDLIPMPAAPPTDPNPSGKWVAYDTNVFESLNFPQRQPGDTTTNDPPGSGDPRYGFCPPPEHPPFGKCLNHQLEYLDYFEEQMTEILGDFGVVMKRYPFISAGSGLPAGAPLSAPGGTAINIAAVVPGADDPDETVLVSGHYDFTDSGPAAAWDSAEGHTEVMRIAKILADYWRATGTRPSATVKFIPWDSEESGTFGSIDYVQNNIPPGQEEKIRGYFNMDPCAGAYPAYKYGNPADRTPEVLQLTDPETYTDPNTKARVEAFNARAETIVDEVFEHLDDTLQTSAGEEPIFVADSEASTLGVPSQRGEIVTALGGLAAFSSDYANFAGIGVPIFNLFPDYFGPHADGTPGQNDGIAILHTPNDNLTSLNRLTSAEPTGLMASEGWMKGMEMCAHMEGWYMLQPEMGGAQTANDQVVAYFEALPNEALQNEQVTFDAGGSYRYSDEATNTIADDATLTYEWDFGDGTTGTGKTVQHGYPEIGRYNAELTVTGGGSSATMTVPITVIGSDFAPPVLDAIPADPAKDGTFDLGWTFETDREGFDHFSVEESKDFTTLLADDAEAAIEDKWTVGDPTAAGLEPWQKSDSATEKWMGNKFHSGAASYWTGVTPPNSNPPPLSADSVLTLTEPLGVPDTTTAELQYWSLFKSESDDRGRVEVAIEDGNAATPLEFETLETLGGPNDTFSPGDDYELTFRRVDLARFAGRDIILRFVYNLGPTNPALSQPAGWYIDDVRASAGNFEQVGTPEQTSFSVTGRSNGTYAYRVLGVFNDGIPTAPSNVEPVEVTEGGAGGACPSGQGTQVIGTDGADILVGEAGADTLCGLDGNDVLRGKGGRDLLLGGDGNDRLRGGAGNDVARGSNGKDIVSGGKGNDRLHGGKGNDRLRGGAGKDRLNGAGGDDDVNGGSGSDFCKGGPGRDETKGCESGSA
ncbi:MAG TPA: M28 family peptidase [Actinomycetota bacterium]